MDAAQMAKRCPNGVVLCPGLLVGYRFRINSRGVATLVPDGSGRVHGIIWHLTAGDEEALDRYEGVRWGTYSKATLPIQVPVGKSRDCLVYVAKDSVPGQGRPGYLDGIVAAAIQHGFPSQYVEELRSWSKTRA